MISSTYEHTMSFDTLFYPITLLKKVLTYFWHKIFAGSFVGFLAFFFDGEHLVPMTALMMLIVADMLTGIMRSYKTGEEIKSARILRTALKVFIYYLMISTAHMFDIATLGSFGMHFDMFMIGFLALTEFISIIENAGHMGYVVPRKLLNQLKSYQSQK